MIIIYEDMKLDVLEGVYKPAEDTFLLADNLDVLEGEKVLELGTGSGLISILAARNGAEVVATDINPGALECARENATKYGVLESIDFREGDLFEPVKKTEKFDLVVFNPPYLPVPKEESSGEIIERAWEGGADGRRVIDDFLDQVFDYIEPSGRFYFVQSSLSGVPETLKKLDSRNIEVIKKKENYFFEKLYLFKVFLKS